MKKKYLHGWPTENFSIGQSRHRKIILKPGDENQLIGFLRAGQGNVTRALKVVDVFLQYQQYNKNGNYCYILFTFLSKNQDTT